ncbi:MAG: chaperone NapD [Thiobacillaceae bacterium]
MLIKVFSPSEAQDIRLFAGRKAMNLSGVLVVARPDTLSSVAQALSALRGVEVHQQDPLSGRLVAVLEAEDILAETELLRRIQSLPGVAMAEMVTHYFGEDEQIFNELPAELQSHPGLSDQALAELNDPGRARGYP